MFRKLILILIIVFTLMGFRHGDREGRRHNFFNQQIGKLLLNTGGELLLNTGGRILLQ
jgi:hypothetical protein